MHKVEPWAYLRDVLTIVQAWPQTRVLELAPAFWNETRQKPEMQQMLKERQLESDPVWWTPPERNMGCP